VPKVVCKAAQRAAFSWISTFIMADFAGLYILSGRSPGKRPVSERCLGMK
jgi:hypothetical protein